MTGNNRLERMKQEYAVVLTAIHQQKTPLSNVHIQDNKLFIQGLAPSEPRHKDDAFERILIL